MTTKAEREEDRALLIEHRLTRIEIWLAILTVAMLGLNVMRIGGI
jgi:hypothetical protein